MNAINPARIRRQPVNLSTRLTVEYGRFSTTGQIDGISEDRQRENNQAYADKHDLTINRSYFDRGASAFHEAHLKGEFGRLLNDIASGDIPAGSILLVESLDRLSRAKIITASRQFTTILDAGITIVTTLDGKAYDGDSDQIIGDFFGATGHQIGNHQASKDKSERMVKSHQARRGTFSAIMPSWITKIRDVQVVSTVKAGKQINRTQAVTTDVQLDPEKAAIVRRLGCDLLLKMGFDSAAQVLNREGVPTLNGRKLSRTEAVWDASMIKQLFADGKVIGEQSVYYWENGKRYPTGETVKNAYPAAMTEAEYFRLTEVINARKRGSSADGRKLGQVTNLFGNLGRCALCGNRMTVQTRGKGFHLYYACSMGKLRKCEASKYHRLDGIEAGVLSWLAVAAVGSQSKPEADPAKVMQDELEICLMECGKLETRRNNANDELMDDRNDPAKRRDFERHHANWQEKLAQVRRLESSIAAKRNEKPASEELTAMRRLVTGLQTLPEAKRIETRSMIAASLPAIVKALTFDPTGDMTLTTVDTLPASLPNSREGDVVRMIAGAGHVWFWNGQSWQIKGKLHPVRTGGINRPA